MKKIALMVLLLALALPIAFAQGKITSIESTEVVVTALKSGHISIKTASNDVILDSGNRAQLLKVLKAHASFLQTASADKIEIERTAFTGYLSISIVTKLGFRLYINTYKDNPFVFEMTIGRECVGFTLDGLNQLVKAVETAEGGADGYTAQSKKLEAMIDEVETSFN